MNITKSKKYEKVSIGQHYRCVPLEKKDYEQMREFYKKYGNITNFINWMNEEKHITMQRIAVSKAVNQNSATNVVWSYMKEYKDSIKNQ